ncbi:hypothetical protein R4J00_03260 [Brachyspira intermedia]|uniref:hypothetical protein n=1 Tax=Brachyspira intermedia TaxID=84377 RepID=UPI003004B9BE
MKKLLFIIYFSIAALFLTSCGGHFFNPRYYYNRSSSSSSSGSAPDTGPEKLPDEVPADEDPFKLPEDYNDLIISFLLINLKIGCLKQVFRGISFLYTISLMIILEAGFQEVLTGII